MIGVLILSVLAVSTHGQETVRVSNMDQQQFDSLYESFVKLLNKTEIPINIQWQKLGLHFSEDQQALYLKSDDLTLFGQGEIVISKDLKNNIYPIMIQVPHKYFDRHSGTIGRGIFEQGGFHVYMENTVQRYTTEWSDMAHESKSLFAAFTMAYTEVYPHSVVVQVHGFSSRKRHSKVARYADVILSNGTPLYDDFIRKIQQCHRIELGLVSRVFGLDVFELGATTNTIGAILNKDKNGHFVHLELSAETREKNRDENWLRKMGSCLKIR